VRNPVKHHTIEAGASRAVGVRDDVQDEKTKGGQDRPS
jgi:hypothetical protein